MVTIELYYTKTQTHAIEFPTQWSELAQDEVKLIAHSLYDEAITKYDIFIALIKNRLLALGVPPHKINTWLRNINREQMAQEIDNMLAFIKEDIDLTTNQYPTISIPKNTKTDAMLLHGPQNNFQNLTCGEYEDAEAYFLTYNQTQDPTDLLKLVASLYRLPSEKPNHHSNDWKNYNPTTAYTRFENTDPTTIFSTLLFFIGCRSRLPFTFPLVFLPAENHPTESPESPENHEIDPMAFTRLVHHGAGLKNGTRDNIRKMLLTEFLFDCQLEAEKSPDIIK